MINYPEWHAELSAYIILAEDARQIKIFEDEYNVPVKSQVLSSRKANLLDQGIVEFYKMFNGFKFLWSKDETRTIGGRMNFLKMEQVLQDWKGNLYSELDVEENDMIEYFHPFDLITDEAQCGVMIGMEYSDNEIYYNTVNSPETPGLDLDFNGYLEMAKEARVYYYWPQVILDIQNSRESKATLDFKENMPAIFPDFNWEKFVAKYEVIRLSNNEE